MIEIIAHNLAPIMFLSLIGFLLLGYPVAFSLAANGLIFFAIGVWLTPMSGGEINLSWALLGGLQSNMWRIFSNEQLLAIPFFTFMGIILEKSGMAEDLLDTVGQLFGPIRGGLAYAVILVGALLAATTGVVAASVIAMGLISLPIMLRYGYDRRLSAGVIAASGTLAQIIPPSLVLIVLADQLGRSVGDMYKGAIIPGLILVGLYMGYILIISIIRPKWVPALPVEVRTLGNGITSLLVALAALVAIGYAAHLWLYEAQGPNADILGATIGVVVIYAYTLVDKLLGLNTMSRLSQQVIMVLIPPLALIFLVLGTIFIGLATPTEAGAMGAVGALVLAFLKRRLTTDVLTLALASTTRLSAFVMFILIGARVFSLTFYGVNGHIWVEDLLTSVPGGEVGFLIVINIILFVLGCFLDFFEIAFIIVPLLIAPAQSFGIDLIWLGVIIGMNLQTSFLTPPFGFALFYLRSVAAKVPYVDKLTGRRMEPVTTPQIYAGAVSFISIQVVMIALVVMFPQLVMHYKGEVIDPSTIEIKVPTLQTLSPGGTTGGATLGAPTLGAPNLGGPTLGAPKLEEPNLGAPQATTPDATAPAEGGTAAPALPKLGAPVINP